jgi:hypothetical protein
VRSCFVRLPPDLERGLARGAQSANRLLCRATYSGGTARHKMTLGLSLLPAVTIRQRAHRAQDGAAGYALQG